VVAGEHPLGLAAGLNLYAYAGNDPVNGKDPLGLSACSVYVTGRLIWWSDGSVTFESWFKSVVCEETLIGLEEGAAGGGQQPQQPQPKPQGPACRDARLLLALWLASDIGFFATGGLSGIASLGRAGTFVLKELAMELPRSGRLYTTFAVAEARRAGQQIAGAYIGTKGVAVGTVAVANAAGLAFTGQHFNSGRFLRSVVPVLGTIDAYKTMSAACGS
jgi:hypothetical protein